MYYYDFHINDFRSGCHNMTRQEKWLYRDMLDVYYDTESPLPDSIDEICKIIGARGEEEKKAVSEILLLKFEQTDRGWVNKRCEDLIEQYHGKKKTASDAGKASAQKRAMEKAAKAIADANRKSNASSTDDQRSLNEASTESNASSTNHKPITKNQEPKEKVKTIVPPTGETAEVFSYWQVKMNHQQAKLDVKRSKAITARLRDGYTVGELCEAIDGCLLSPHHMGKNDTGTVYDDIELICRDGPKVDRFIKLARQGGPQNELQAYMDDLATWAAAK
jgi:uncharacterized protein YdaU (DUF1376 family)